ncbi:MAG: FkbM family methyltransferase [Tepidisphaeraceae bacterium]
MTSVANDAGPRTRSHRGAQAPFLRSVAKTMRDVLLPRTPKVRRFWVGPGRGLRMVIDYRLHSAVYFGLCERELDPHFRELVRPGYKCFDVGGHIGYHALLLAKLSGGAPVTTFEVRTQHIQEMRRNFAQNPYPIEIVQAYISETSDATGHNLSLDDVAARSSMPDFIKMDIEGAEVDALRGARRILAERKPGLVVEVHGMDREEGCLQILKEHGYKPHLVDPRRSWHSEQRGDQHNRWIVCEGRGAA